MIYNLLERYIARRALPKAELESFCAYARDWHESRHRHGLHTPNDDRYDSFCRWALIWLRAWASGERRWKRQENLSGGQS